MSYNFNVKNEFYSRLPVEIPSELLDLVPGFLERRKSEATNLQVLAGRRDLEQIQKIAHKLKGHGAGYGFFAISYIGSDLEKAAKAGQWKEIYALIDQYEDLVDEWNLDYCEKQSIV